MPLEHDWGAVTAAAKDPKVFGRQRPPFDPSVALGVGHNCAAIVKGIPAPFPFFAVTLSRSRLSSHVPGDSPS